MMVRPGRAKPTGRHRAIPVQRRTAPGTRPGAGHRRVAFGRFRGAFRRRKTIAGD